jgi:N-acetylglutamate synthase-like GNAT family acetyltransferase
MKDKTETKIPPPKTDLESRSPSAEVSTAEGEVEVFVTSARELSLADAVSRLLAHSSHESGAIVLPRSEQFIADAIKTGYAVMARVVATGEVVGFGYLETWKDAEIVTHGGLVVHPAWRKQGIGKRIKRLLFETARGYYPTKSLVSLTVDPSIIKMNVEFGYRPKAFEQLPAEPRFWDRCKACSYHDTLERFSRRQCFCLGMVFDAQN